MSHLGGGDHSTNCKVFFLAKIWGRKSPPKPKFLGGDFFDPKIFFACGGLILGGVRYGILFLQYFFADVALHIDKNADLPGPRQGNFDILHVEIKNN